MMEAKPLDARELHRSCDPAQFSFRTTAELEDLTNIVGQNRALDAIQFGVDIQETGYNIFVMGPAGAGKFTTVRQLLTQRAAAQSIPAEWCYLFNFDNPHKPRAVQLRAGEGAALRLDMTSLIEDLRIAIPAAFESDEYRARIHEIEEEFKERQDHAIDELRVRAKEDHIELIRTPAGFAFAPSQNGEVLNPEEFERLPEKDQERISDLVNHYHEQMRKLIHQIPQWQKETRTKIKSLNQEVAMSSVGHLIDALRVKYEAFPVVMKYLDDVQQDIIGNIDEFRRQEEVSPSLAALTGAAQTPVFRRYEVNVVVDRSVETGAPVLYEDNPSYQNLIGRIEHYAMMGALLTDFTMIKGGALHRANGGFLILDAHKVLMQPFAWEGLKRTLRSREIRIESLEQLYSLASTVSLQPESIPLDIKVILIGDRELYYLLYALDPEFQELFKVMADFEDRIERNAENQLMYARLIARMARKHLLLPFDRDAVARVIEYSSRNAEDAEKISTHMRSLAEIMQEANYWARQSGNGHVGADHVRKAIDTRLYHASRLREHALEAIRRKMMLIDTEGEVVGQINALTVFELGSHSFGTPNRVTANVRFGKGEIIDIEREVELGGPIHSKGVMILSSYLGERYSSNIPLSLSASLVFEQSYGEVEGDSASAAELFALISALANVPIKQSFAVTGSVNQRGQIQAIGGVNEKIEGFFDVCRQRGLDGNQGVLIPASNVQHLMLRQDIIEAAAAGKFHVYAIETIDQGMEILTGLTAGEPDQLGIFPEGSINQHAQARLIGFAQIKASFEDD